MSGSVWLNFSPQPAQKTLITVTLDYSVPLAGDITLVAVVSMVSLDDDDVDLRTSVNTMVEGDAENDDNGWQWGPSRLPALTPAQTFKIWLSRGVMLDVSGASGTVSVTVKVTSSDDTDFIRIDGPSSATVIEDILVGVTVKVDPEVVRTRGTGVDGITTSLTLEESFEGGPS